MNQRKLHLEIMRAIMRSSTLDYDEAYPVVASFIPQIERAVRNREQEIETQNEEVRKRKKNESQKTGSRSL